MIDITKTGPVGLKGLKSVLSNRANSVPLNNTQQLIENAASQIPGNHMNARQVQAAFTPAPIEHHGIELGEKGVGLSSYDNNMKNRAQADDLNDYRFSSQSGLMQLTNGVIKAGTTALTTALDGTFGTIYGLGQGIYNALDDNPNTGFLDGLWNNDFNKAMQSAQNEAENIFPNYYSNQQMNSDWDSAANILSANFIGNKIIKNAGFTIGAIATMATPGINGSWIAKALSSLSNVFNSVKAAHTIEGISNIATRVARTLVSAHAESAVEAINTVESNKKVIYGNLDNRRNQAVASLENQYANNIKNGMSSDEATQIYHSGLNNISNAYKEAKGKADEFMVNSGNSDYMLNMALLSLDNNLEFSRYLKGGFNTQKGARLFKTLVSGKPVEDMGQFGKAMAKGTASLSNNMVAPGSVGGIAKAVAGTIGHGIEEGNEEGMQDMFSDTNELVAQARLNKWANQKYRTDKDRYSLFAARINPDASNEMADYTKAAIQTWQNDFGSFSSPGWQDVTLGAVTGMFGTPFGISRNEKGNIKADWWQGGLVDELKDVSENYAHNQLMIDDINKSISDPKFTEKARHTIAAITFANDMNEGLQNNNVKMFKNAELMSVVNDALHFKQSGLSDAFTSFYKEASHNITKDDINAVRSQMRELGTDKSYFSTMSDDELKSKLQDKAASTLDKINNIMDNYDNLNIKYKDTFDKVDPQTSQAAIEHLTSLKSLYDDLQRRQDEIKQTKNSSDDSTQNSYDEQIKDVQDSMDKIKSEYNDYIKNPVTLSDKIKDIAARVEKAKNLSNDENALNSYSTSSTLKDVYDTYYYNKKPEVLDEAINNAEGKNKELLKTFKSFNTELSATKKIVTDVVSDSVKEVGGDDVNAENMKSFIGENIINPAIENLVNDKNAAYTKDSISSSIKEYLKQVSPEIKNADSRKFLEDIVNKITDNLDKITVTDSSTGNEEGEAEKTDDLVFEDMPQGNGKSVNEKSVNTEPVNTQKVKMTPVKKSTIDSNNTIKDGIAVKSQLKNNLPNYREVSDEGVTHIYNGSDYVGTVNSDKSITLTNDGKSKYFNVLNDTKVSGRSRKNKKTKKTEGTVSTKNTAESKKNPVTTEEEIPFTENLEKEETPEKPVENLNTEEVKQPVNKPVSEPKNTNGQKNDSVIPDTGKQQSEDNVKIINPEETKELPLPNSSYRSNAFQQYEEDLKKEDSDNRGVARERKADSAKIFRAFLKSENLDIDYITNYKLNELRDKDGNLDVHYMMIKGRPNDIFLAIPYNEEVQKVIPRGSYGERNVKHTNNGDFLIVGTMGYYYTKNNEALKKGHDYLKNKINEERAQSKENGKYFASYEGNTIYDMSPGSVVRRYEGEEKSLDSNVAELLGKEESNPYNFTPDKLVWGVVTGTPKDKFRMTFINGDNKETILPDNMNEAGKVYLYIPDGAGHYIPSYITPMSYNDRFNHDFIEKLVDNIVNSKDDKERNKNINILRDNLLFSYGNNIYYNSTPTASDYDTIKYRKGNIPQEGVINFREDSGQTKEEQKNILLNMLKDINPRINISIDNLTQNPSFYINRGLINTGTKILGTVNAQGYLYPIDSKGNPIRNFHATSQDNIVVVKRSAMSSLYVNDNMYYYDGNNYFDKNKNIITDDEELKKIKDIRQIQMNKVIPVEVNKTKYWNVNGSTYYMNRGNSYIEMTGRNLEILNKLIADKEIGKTRNMNIIEATPIERHTDVVMKEDEETKKINKTIKKESAPKKLNIPLNGNYQKFNVNTKNNLDIRANSGNFENVYKKLAKNKKDTLKQAVENAVGSKSKNAKDIIKTVSQSNKEASGLINNINNEEDIDRLIESINKCGL